ncbi:MAG: methyl-accepting chemotaxis protein, partial [Bacteroidota bacterium]
EVKSTEATYQKLELEQEQNNLMNAINDTNVILNQVVDSGNFSLRMDTSEQEGQWKHLGESINGLFDSLMIPFGELNRIVNHLSSGDLTERYTIEAKGEVLNLADNLNVALDNVSELIGDISLQAERIRLISETSHGNSEKVKLQISEMSQSITEISKGSGNQVMQVNDTSALIENILKSSDEISDQANTINSTSSSGVDKSKTGVDMIGKVGNSMNDILQFFDRSTESINDLIKYSSEISEILNIIQSIASQTNLLALNAAIEAAQAGDAGRGFSVIATEIRKLAEQSQDSAKQIETLVSNVQKSAGTTHEFITDMNDVVKSGEQSAEEAKNSFADILSSYNETFNLSNEIVSSTQKQTEDLKQIVSLVEQIVVISEETAAGAEQAATSATHVSEVMNSYHTISQDILKIANELMVKTGKFSLEKEEEDLEDITPEVDPSLLEDDLRSDS